MTGRPRSPEVRRRRVRRRRAGHRPARPQVRRRAVRHPHRLRPASSTSSTATAPGTSPAATRSPTTCPPDDPRRHHRARAPLRRTPRRARAATPARSASASADSPAGLLAWILERWQSWSDNGGDVESVFTKDDLLTHATIYWAGNSIDTSIRYYANNNRYPWTPSHDRQPGHRGPDRHHLRRLREPARHHHRRSSASSHFLASDRSRLVQPRQRHRPPPRRPLHPLGNPDRMDHRPQTNLPPAPLARGG